MAHCRVRLEFAEALGRFVRRQRGFSSCWYLIPHEVELVGDLAYFLQWEFGLQSRCAQGLELRLDGLPLLATQSIQAVRDNDMIAVHGQLGGEVIDISSDEEKGAGDAQQAWEEDEKQAEKLQFAEYASSLDDEKKPTAQNRRDEVDGSYDQTAQTEGGGDKAASIFGSDDSDAY